MFDSSQHEQVASPDPVLLSDAVTFREDPDQGVKKPVSPINIVMSFGGMNSVEAPAKLNHEKGIKNLVSATMPVVPDKQRNESENNNSIQSTKCNEPSKNVFSFEQTTERQYSTCPRNFMSESPIRPDSAKSDDNTDANVPPESPPENGDKTENASQIVRIRSRNSARHRMVQILSESDLDVDFGPFVGFESSKPVESGENVEQKRKASLLKLIDGDAVVETGPGEAEHKADGLNVSANQDNSRDRDKQHHHR